MKHLPLTPQVSSQYQRWLGDIKTSLYRPYLTVRSFNSAGTCSIVWSRKTGRNHHLLSQGETRCFLYIESLSNVRNIYEQYALNPDLTLDIAGELGLRHRSSNKLRSILPVTTDFVVEYQIGKETQWAALAYKPRNILAYTNPQGRVRGMVNGLRIEETYWERVGKPWRLTFEAEYPRVVIYNIEFFRTYQTLSATEEAKRVEYQNCFSDIWKQHSTLPLHSLIHHTGNDLRLDSPDALNIFKYLAWHRKFPIDLNRRVELYLSLPILRAT